MESIQLKFHMTYVIEGSGALVNEVEEETPLKQAILL